MKLNNKHQGFSLIEIAIVLIILSVALGGLVGSLANRMEAANRDKVEKELKEIKKVLIAYAFSQTPPYLPCPDTPVDGISATGFEKARVAGVCPGENGFLPWKTLGIGNADAWGNRYRYWVNRDFSNSAGFSLATNNDNSATINTRAGNITDELANNAVVVVFSPGRNMLGGLSSDNTVRLEMPEFGQGYDDERENWDGDNVYYQRPPSLEGAAQTGGVFDDVLIWLSIFEIKSSMIEAGVLP